MKKVLIALLLLLGLSPAVRASVTTTSRMGLAIISTGTTNWGPILNANTGVLDSSAAALGQPNAFTAPNTFYALVSIKNTVAISSDVTMSGSTGLNVTNTVTAAQLVGGGAGITGVTAGSVAAANVAAGSLGTGVIASSIAVNAVATASIQASAVDTGKLATDAVSSAKLLNGAVTNAKIGSLAVDTGKLAADSVITSKIINAAVDTTKLASDSVTTAKIISQAVTAAKVADGTLTNTQMAAGSFSNITVPSANVAAGALTDGVRILPDGVDLSTVTTALAGKQASGNYITATTGDVVASGPGSVTATIQAGAVDTGKHATDSVTTVKILNLNVTTGKIAALAVDTSKLAADAVTTSKVLDANITDAKIATVSGSKVSGNISGNAANITGNLPTAQIDLSTITTAINAEATSRASGDQTNAVAIATSNAAAIIPSRIDLSTVTSALALKMNLAAVAPVYIDLSTVTTALAGKLSTTAPIAANLIDLSTVTTALAGKLSTTAAISPTLIDLSTVTTALAGKQATGNYVTALTGDVTASGPGSVAATIAAAAVDTGKLATDSVTTAKILNLNVTTAKLAASAVDTTKIAADAVTSAGILNGTIATVDLADGAVDTAKTGTDSVTTAKILNLNVTTGKIAASAIDTTKLATDAVTNSAILNATISAAKMAAGGIFPAIDGSALTNIGGALNGGVAGYMGKWSASNAMTTGNIFSTASSDTFNGSAGVAIAQSLTVGTITAPSGSYLILSTGASAGSPAPDNLSISTEGSVYVSRSGAASNAFFHAMSTTNLTTAEVRDTVFAVALSSALSNAAVGLATRQAFFAVTQSAGSAPKLTLESVNGTTMLGPIFNHVIGSGTLATPAIPGGASLDNLLIYTDQTQFQDGAALRNEAYIKYNFGVGISTDLTNRSYPSEIHIGTTRPNASAAVDSLVINSSGSVAIANGLKLGNSANATQPTALLVVKSTGAGSVLATFGTTIGVDQVRINTYLNADGNDLPSLIVNGPRSANSGTTPGNVTGAKAGVFVENVDNGLATIGDQMAVLSVQSASVGGGQNTGRVLEVKGELGISGNHPDVLIARENGQVFIGTTTGQAGQLGINVPTNALMTCTSCAIQVAPFGSVAGVDFGGWLKTGGSLAVSDTMTVTMGGGTGGILDVPKQPCMHGDLTGAQSIPYNVTAGTQLYWGSQNFTTTVCNTQSMFDATNSSGQVRIPVAGNYDIRGQVSFANGAGGQREVFCKGGASGTTVIAVFGMADGSNLGTDQVNFSGTVKAAANDLIKCYAIQNQTSTLALTVGNSASLNGALVTAFLDIKKGP